MSKYFSGVSIKIVVVSVLVIVCVGLVLYIPSLKMGFYTDDYTYLEYAGRLTVPQYLANALDPRTPFITWRPLLRLVLLVEYGLVRFEASYYHLVQVLLHLGNCLLLFGIVWSLSHRWRLAVVSSLLYAGLPTYSWAVFWIAVHDPSATFFYLLAIWMWVLYLRTRRRRDYFFTLGALGLALLGKETSVTAPVALFLVDRWFIGGEANLWSLLKRYSGILIVLGTYVALEYVVQSSGIFVTEGNYSVGPQIITNLVSYLGMLIAPWVSEITGVWIGLFAVVYVVITVLKRSVALAFIGVMVLLNIAPVLLIPWTIQGRYLYLAAMGQAIVLAMILEWGRRPRLAKAYTLVGAGIISGLLIANGLGVASSGDTFSEIARQARVPIRDIMRQHPDLPSDTLLYLIEPPGSVPDIQGMFFQRYGANVLVEGTFEDGMSYVGGKLRQQPARLQDHALSYVYYFDTDKRPIEVEVSKGAATQTAPELPIAFSAPIRLEGYDLTSSAVKRGNSMVLLLNWRAEGWIERDYTVFVHLVDQYDNIVSSEDAQPRSAHSPTSSWKPGMLIVDGHILTVSPDVPPGQYRLEVGLYYLPTLERLQVVDDRGNPVTDQVLIQSFAVVD